MSVYIYQSPLTKRNIFNSSLLQFFTKFTDFSPDVTGTQSTSTSKHLDLLYSNFLSTSEITNTLSLKIKFANKRIELQFRCYSYHYHNSNSLFLKSDIPQSQNSTQSRTQEVYEVQTLAQCFLHKKFCNGPSQEKLLKGKNFLQGNCKNQVHFWIHFCTLIPSNYFIFLLQRSQMYIITASSMYSYFSTKQKFTEHQS